MATATEPPVMTQTRGRILIVDDELVVRDSLGKWFTSEGYTAQPVSGAREALEVIQRSEYDIALIDIKMPGMDGMELQARLKEADPERVVPRKPSQGESDLLLAHDCPPTFGIVLIRKCYGRDTRSSRVQ